MAVRFDVEVALALGADISADPATWTWTDITTKCMVRDGGVRITRGRRDWQTNAQPATCEVLVDNADGRFSRLNPLGAYYGQLTKNTPLRIALREVVDTFTRTVASGLGTTDTGQTYTLAGGAAGDYAVNGSAAVFTLPDTNSRNCTVDAVSVADFDAQVKITPGQTSTGTGGIDSCILGRLVDFSNHYEFTANFDTAGTVDLFITRVKTGTFTTIASAANVLTYTPGTAINVRAQAVGTTLRLKAWAGAVEPGTWNVTVTDTSFSAGKTGLRAQRNTGNTNVNPTISFDNMTVRRVRFTGFISEFPPRWDPSGSHFWVPLRADGVLRRLGQGAVAKSAMRRTVLSSGPVAYWPLEDDANATAGASALDKGQPMVSNGGTVTWAAQTDLVGSLHAPTISSALLRGSMQGASSTSWHAEFAIKSAFVLSAVARVYAGGFDAAVWRIFMPSAAGQPVTVFVTNPAGDIVIFSLTGSAVAASFQNTWHHIAVTAEQSGSSVVGKLYVDGVLQATNSGTGTLGAPAEFWANHLLLAEVTSMAHIVVGSGTTLSGMSAALNGYPGEAAHTRFARLCAEESIAANVTATTSQAMGPQGVGAVADPLHECEQADSGLIVERLTGTLGFDSHTDRENLAAAMALDYTQGHVTFPFEPADDDRAVRNDVTVTRSAGSSGRVVDDTSVAAAGRYDESLTLNLSTDEQAVYAAGWRVNLGTVDEYRYPQIRILLHGNTSLLDTWLACDIGSRTTIANLPNKMPPDVVDQIVEGYTEQIDNFSWTVDVNLSPYRPYKVFEVASDVNDTSEFVGRLAGDAKAAIRSAITSAATSIPFDPNFYRWTTRMLWDGFGRTVASSWDGADSGQTWSNSGTASDYSVSGGGGKQSLLSVGSLRLSTLTGGSVDGRLVADVSLDVASASGATVTQWVCGRVTDVNNMYYALLSLDTSGNVLLAILKRVAATPTTIVGNITVGTGHAANDVWRVMFEYAGTSLRAKAWKPATSSQPSGWQLDTTDASLTSGTSIAVGARLEAGNTNTLPVTATWDNVGFSDVGDNPDDFPLTARLGGETVTVSGIATTAGTFVAGGTMSSADNAAVTPALYTGATANDLILVLAAVRSPSAATLATPTGYTRLPVWSSTDKIQLYAKVHSGSESAPTITPSGGAAGDTVCAVTFGLRNTPVSLANLADVVLDSATLTNSAAQNIAYPGLYPNREGCIVLALGVKDTDWTSVAALTGFTEAVDASTVTGNKQGVVIDYQIQTAPAVAAEGSFVVTGGIAAVSRAATVAIAGGYQTMTVSARAVNGASKAQTAATKVEVDDALVLGL